MFAVSGNTLQQVEKFMYCVVLFTNDGRHKEIDTRTGMVNAGLRRLYRSVMTKWELSNIVQILNYDLEFWVMTGRILPQVQATEITFFRNVYDVTLLDKVRSFQFRKVLNVEPLLLRIGRCQLWWFSYVSRNVFPNLFKARTIFRPVQTFEGSR